MVIGLVREIRPSGEKHLYPSAHAQKAVEHLITLPGREPRIHAERFSRQDILVFRKQGCANQRLVVARQSGPPKALFEQG